MIQSYMHRDCHVLTVTVFTCLQIVLAIPPPGPPQHLSVVSDVTNIGVQWEPPTESNGIIRNYIVSWSILPNTTEITNIVSGDVTMSIISVQGHTGRLFRIRVRAENEGGIGQYSKPKYTRIRCGKIIDIFPRSNVTVTYPKINSGNEIMPGVLCMWTFRTIARYSLEVDFDYLEFGAKGNHNCSNIYIDISGIGRVCDKTRTRQHTRTTLPSLQMTLKSGLTAGGRGFRVTVKSVLLLPGPPTHIFVKTTDHAIIMSWEPPREITLPVTAYRIRYGVILQKRHYSVTLGHGMRQFSINTKTFEGKLMTISVSALIGTEEGAVSKTRFVRAPCRRHINLHGTRSVNISSPGYPNAYPSNIICTWFVSSNATSLITYLDFRLEDTLFCSSDFVTFSFKENVEHECSRMVLPKTIETNAQNYNLTFVTDGKNEFPGFLIEISSKVAPEGLDINMNETNSTEHINTENLRAMTSSTPLAFISTTNKLITSSVFVKEQTTGNTRSTVTSTRNQTTRQNSDSQSVFAQSVTTSFSVRNVSYNHETLNVSTTNKAIVQYKLLWLLGNTTSEFVIENTTAYYDFVSSTSGRSNHVKGPKQRGNGILVAVILSTTAFGSLLIITTCYVRWRQRHGKMKIGVEPAGKYKVTNIELYDILRTSQQSAWNRYSKPCLNAQRGSLTSVFATRCLETIPETPEDIMNKVKHDRKSERKRCHSFPCSLSIRKRKIHNEIRQSLNTFEFIEDKQSLEKILQRKYCLTRSNSM